MASKRESIIAAFVNQAKLIKTTSGYQTNIGLNVFRAVKAVGDNALPACVIWPLSETSERARYDHYIKTFDMRVEGFSVFRSGEESMDSASLVAEKLLSDIVTAFGMFTTTYSTDIVYASGGTDIYPEPGETIVGVSAVFKVTYKTALNRADI
jgi:hypothetical protein